MRVFTVHMRRPTLDPMRDVVLVKEGFSWPAFAFSVLWALWCRLWLIALGLFAVEVVANAAIAVIAADTWTRLALSLGLMVMVGLVGNDLKRWTLFRRGYLQMGVVTGADMDAAEQRFWDQRPRLAADLVR
jgi:uncharacterized protein DUF2628